LGDIQTLFRKENTDRMASQDIVEALSELEERPWADWKRGKPLGTNQLALILKNYEVKPKEIKINGRNLRGYKAEDLQDTFERYLVTPSQTATPLLCSNDAAFREIQSATQQIEVAVENRLKPAPNKESSRVADQNTGRGANAEDKELMQALIIAAEGLPITPERLLDEAAPEDYPALIEDAQMARDFAKSVSRWVT